MIGTLIALVFCLGIPAALIAGVWKTFVKAGLPGWASLVPIYNLYLMWQMTGKPFNWFIYCFVPVANIIFMPKLMIEVARAFGKGTGVGIALFFGVGWPILGFGDARYEGKPIQQAIPTAVPALNA